MSLEAPCRDACSRVRFPQCLPAARPEGYRLEYHNVAYLLDGGTVRGLVAKNYLMLFGEYLPFERTFPWLGNFRCLAVRYERSLTLYNAFFHLACCIILVRWL